MQCCHKSTRWVIACLYTTFAVFCIGINSVAKPVDQGSSPRSSSSNVQPADSTIGDQAIKMFLDKIEVLGRLEKPQAVFIVPGTNPEIDDIRIDRSFFSEIFRPVEKSGRKGFRGYFKGEKMRKDYIPW